MIGYPVSKSNLEGTIGGLVVELRDRFQRIINLKAWFDNNADDTALGVLLGITTADATAYRGVVVDLYNLVQTANGLRAQAVANDFLFNARKATGLN